MNILKHIYAIKEMVNNFDIPNRNIMTNLFIEHMLNVERANLLGRYLENKSNVLRQNYSTICVDMELAVKEDCTGNCIILKSVKPLPDYIGTLYVMSGNLQMHRITQNISMHRKKSLANKEGVAYYVENNYLYIENNVALESVMVRAIFVSLAEVNNPELVNCNCNNCLKDYDFAIDPKLIDVLYSLVMNALVGHGNAKQRTKEEVQE